MPLSFAEIRRRAPAIHVFGKGSGAVQLHPQPQDTKYDARQYSIGYTEGVGVRASPYTYRSAAPVSAHYIVVDLWFTLQSQAGVVIQVNEWLLTVSPEGVTAEDGHFTRLLPT